MIEPLPVSYSLLLAERFEYKWEWVEAIAQLKLKEGDRLLDIVRYFSRLERIKLLLPPLFPKLNGAFSIFSKRIVKTMIR